MAQRLTIKQIAALAGVSVGTVDRVLHNRGMVSDSALAAINAVLKDKKYEYNIHTSAVAFRKTKKVFRILISIPSSNQGEYWDMVRHGIESGLREYNDIPIRSEFIFFDQFDASSCKKAFSSIASQDCSAVILGTTFAGQVRSLCGVLDSKKVPYVFVDGRVDETSPVASFSADQVSCGRLMARLMDRLTPEGSEVALLLPKRKGTLMSTNSGVRLESFKSFFREKGREDIVRESLFSTERPEVTAKDVAAFLQENESVKGIAVVISAAYLVADALTECGRRDICVGGFDITDGNVRCLENDTIEFLINQHPEEQGFNAVRSVLHFLLYGISDGDLSERMPIDITFKENLHR